MKTNFRILLTLKAKLFLLTLFMCLSFDKCLIASDKMSEKFLDDILNDTEIPMDRASPTPRVDPFLEGIQFAQGILNQVNSAHFVGSQPKQKRNGVHFDFTPEDMFTRSYMEGLEVVQETNRRIQHIFDNNLRENLSLIHPDDTFTKGYIEGLEFVEELTKQHAEFFAKCNNGFEQDQEFASEEQAEIDVEKSSQEAVSALTIDGEEFSSGALTPRTYSRREAELKAEQNNRLIDELLTSNSWLSPSDESTYRSAYEDVNEAGQKAYLKTQSEIASKANEKIKQGQPLTEYERLVRHDDRVEHQRYWKQMGGYAVGASLGVTAALTAPLSAPLAVGLALTGGAIDGVASLDYVINTRKDAVLVAGSALVGGATLFLPGSGIEVSASMKSILGTARSSFGYGAEKLSSQAASKVAREMAALDLALPRIPNAGKMEVHMTYLKPHPDGGAPYVGRTSGYVTDPSDIGQLDKILKLRDRNHHMNQHGFGRAQLDEISTNPHVIRGLEQIKLDELGGALSTGGTSSNAINSISTMNPNMRTYVDAAAKELYGSY